MTTDVYVTEEEYLSGQREYCRQVEDSDVILSFSFCLEILSVIVHLFQRINPNTDPRFLIASRVDYRLIILLMGLRFRDL